MFRACALLTLTIGTMAAAATWKPIDPAELKDSAPKVEPDADAEALFWEVYLVDEGHKGVRSAILSNYLRIKVYNNRGRDRLSTINIPFNPGAHIDEIEARTIHLDGSIVELGRDAVHESESTTGTFKRKQKSFPMPAVEPGSIIEYRWRETRENGLGYVRMDFQREIPIRIVRYLLKPYEYPVGEYFPQTNTSGRPQSIQSTRAQASRAQANADEADYRAARSAPVMAIQDFQCKRTPLTKHGEYYETSMENVPAFKGEPFMPPADELRSWSLLYYRPDDKIDVAKYWVGYGQTQYYYLSGRIKVSKRVQSVAAEVTKGADTPQMKLTMLSDFCRRKIKNLGTDAVTAEERMAAEKKTNYKTPDDVLKEGVGPPDNIRYLFASLASAEGFEARIAMLPDRRQIFFDRGFASSYFLVGRVVAIKLADEWRFYDPPSTYVPHDLLAWYHQGVPALITDPKTPVFFNTPISSVDQSSSRNTGVFKLSEDGTLEGDVTMVYTGHEGALKKETSERQSAEQREEAFKTMILSRLSTAEVSNIQVENATDIEKPFTYRCHIRVPAYAQRTGRRLFFAPAVLQQRETSLFPVKERKYSVVFSFPRSESDQFTIQMPEGFELTDPEIPAPVSIGRSGRYEVAARIVNGATLVFSRNLTLGKDNQGFDASGYPAIKGIFDAIALSDAYTLTLTQKGAPKEQ
jgi:hypothetical protein